jgi:predicted SnoaL-like aldol condensation-catalyzing enzyme
MNKPLAIICLTMGVLTAALGAPAGDDLVGLTTANGKLAAKMLDLWFNEHKPGEAFDKYVSRTNFVNHTGKETSHSFDDIRTEEIKITGTNLHFDIKQIVAQGDLVFAHIHVINGHSVNGRELVEIMRFKDGKMIEHWNLHGPLDDDPDVFFGH